MVDNGLDSEVSAQESIVPTAPIITTEPIISAESFTSTEDPITSTESINPQSNLDLGLNSIIPVEDPSVASYDSIAPMGTVTLGAEDFLIQQQAPIEVAFGGNELQWRNARVEVNPQFAREETFFEHRVNPILGFRGGQYTLNLTYFFVVNNVEQAPPVSTTRGGLVSRVGGVFNIASQEGYYNIISVTGGSGTTTDINGNPLQITILQFDIIVTNVITAP